jgi:hypothetical protein
MSYCRWGEGSDVYVYLDVNGHLCCCGCQLNEGWYYDSTRQMLAHLEEHKKAGHLVPEYAAEGLREDELDNDDWLARVFEGMCSYCSGDGKDINSYLPEYKDKKCFACNGTGRRVSSKSIDTPASGE